MLQQYLELSGNTEFIIGFEYESKVYIHFTKTLTEEFTRYDRESSKRGGGRSLRLRTTKTIKRQMLTSSIELCEYSELTDDKYNRGEMLESKIYTRFNQVWHKDNKCFTDGGDININGTEYQIKFENATIITEKTLTNILKRGF